MKTLFALLMTTFLVSCVSSPKNTDEFKTLVEKHGSKQSSEINRPLNSVLEDVSRYANACYNYKYMHRTTVAGSPGGGYSGTNIWHSSWENLKTGGKTLSLRMQNASVLKAPESGMYYFAADIRPKGQGGTSVTTYQSSWGTDDFAREVLSAARGENPKCPKRTY